MSSVDHETKDPGTEPSEDCTDEARKNGKGWNINLFVKKDKASQRLCGQCNNVCFNAVELICNKQSDDTDTDDEHEVDYCKYCLSQYLQQNNNKCPVCGHPNASLNDIQYIRNKINRLKIFCPRSNVLKNDNDNEVLLLCKWQGTMPKLKSHLLNECKYGLKKCIYFELGCNHKYIENSKEAQLHDQNYMPHHMQLLLKYIRNDNIPDTKLEQKLMSSIQNLSKSITNIKHEISALSSTKINQINEEKDDDMIDIANEIEIDSEKIIGHCNHCNKDIKYFENDIFNVQWMNNKWQHIDCDYKPQILCVSDTDTWSDKIKSNAINVDKNMATVEANVTGHNHNVFGVITVNNGDDVKEWILRINQLNGNGWIGIINKLKIHQSLHGNNVYKYGISLHKNGTVYCFDKETFQSSIQLHQGDIVSIILDISNNILLFRVNKDSVMIPVTNLNMNLSNFGWKLFVSMNNEGDQIMILDKKNDPNEIKQNIDDEKCNDKVYSCNLCKHAILERDFEINNIDWSLDTNSWKHADCILSSYKLPDLSNSNKNTDQFNKLFAAKSMLLLSNNNYTFTTNKSSVYQTMFGVMSINKGVKLWNIRIENGSSNMYIGIIQSDKIKKVKQNAVPNKGVYYITNNGTINGGQTNISSSLSFKTGDIINVILDMDKSTLGFGKNYNQYSMAKGAVFKDESFNLFVTMYAVNNCVTIIGDNKDKEIEYKEDKGNIVDICSKCNKQLFEVDFDKNNISWNELTNKWVHIACNVEGITNIPKLQLQDRDQWHSQFTHPAMQIWNDKYTVSGGHSTYYNSFGVLSVSNGLKKWNVRVSGQLSYTFIGIITTNAMKRKKQGVPTNEGYYFSYNSAGIRGGGLSISVSTTLTIGDVVNIILDKNKNTLCFGINDNNFTYVKGANLKNSSFNLFCTSFYQNTSFTILGNNDDDEKVDYNSVGKCRQCNKDVYEDELKSNNVQWNSKQNRWDHKDCNVKKTKIIVPKLGINDIDQWNQKLSNPVMRLSEDRYTFVGGTSSYTNVYGVVTVSKGIKTWDIKINCQPSNMYIGVVDKLMTKNKITGIPSKNAYYLTYNGQVKGGTTMNIGYTLRVHDRVKVILDINQNTLCFGINDKNYVYVKGAMLKGRSFNLFCTTYNAQSSVTILGNNAVANNGIRKGRPLYNCSSCGKKIHELDFDINNVKYNSNQWYHNQCNFNIPNLSVNQRDQWNRMTSNRNIQVNNYEATASTGSKHMNAFGIISVTKGTKQWNVKITNGSTSYMNIGIIDSSCIIGKTVGAPSNDGYYLTYNGQIQGSGLSVNAGVSFSKGDIINVVLDMSTGVLSFGKNNTNFSIAKGANIKGRSFNLFCTMYYQNNTVSIQ